VGSLHPSADELCVAVTGQPLNPQVFVEYLKSKYTALYDL
jgi:Zn-dependent M32 family carboxypeptidase